MYFIWYLLFNIRRCLRISAIYSFNSRNDDHITVEGRLRCGDPPMSTRAIEIRKRKRGIVNIIHNSTWVIENLVVVSGLVLQFFALKEDRFLSECVHDTVGLLFARVLVPFTYLYSDHQIKIVILEEGWFRATITALRLKKHSAIQPVDNPRTN